MNLATFLLAAPLFATPCLPSLAVDGAPLPQSCYNTPLLFTPGSTWQLGFEDLPATFADFDGNDLAVLVSFSNTLATFTYQGGFSVLHDTMLVNGVPIFDTFSSLQGTTFAGPVGVLSIAFRARGIGYDATYALPSANTVAYCVSGCVTPVPEPATWVLLAAALLIVAALKYAQGARIAKEEVLKWQSIARNP